MARRTAVLLLTHQWSEVLRLKFERLRAEVGEIADVFILMQKSPTVGRAMADGEAVRQALQVFDAETLPQRLGYSYAFNQAMVPGSAHFPVLEFSLQNRYRHVFTIEHDVEFSGNWGELVAAAAKGSPDFVSLHFFSMPQRPEWGWWRYVRPAPKDLAWAGQPENLRRSFNPVYCLSRRAAEIVHAAHLEGWRGHYEMILATVLTRRGCKLADLRELGQFCIGDKQERLRDELVSDLSTVRWRPEVTRDEFARRSTGRTLFHPVKDSWYYDGSRLVSPASREDALHGHVTTRLRI